VLARLTAHRPLVDEREDTPEGAAEANLATEEEILGDVEHRDDREILVDGLDAVVAGVDRGVERDRAAVDADLAIVRLEGAGENLDERRLSGAVVADEREDLALVYLYVDAAQRLDVPECLRDPTGGEKGRRRGLLYGQDHVMLAPSASITVPEEVSMKERTQREVVASRRVDSSRRRRDSRCDRRWQHHERLPGRTAKPTAGGVSVAQAKAEALAASRWPTTWKGPTTPTKPQTGKKIVVISCSQATACAQEVDGIVEGGKVIGWNMQVVDGKGDPSVYASSIRNAVTSGADGIILASINVGLVTDALRFAKAHKVPVLNNASITAKEAGIDPSLVAGTIPIRTRGAAA
jgi:hypothetical protein